MRESLLKEILENEWLGLNDITNVHVVNPFFQLKTFNKDNPYLPILNLFRQPDFFSFTCKHILNKTIAPFQGVILKELWSKPFPMLIGSRGLSKTFLLAVYLMLRMLFHQGCKVAVCGAAFRQAKYVFEYCEEIWYNAPILRDICGDIRRSPIARDTDRCSVIIGDSTATFLPLGDGCCCGITTYGNSFSQLGEENNSKEKSQIKRDRDVYGNGEFRLSDEVYCNGLSKTKIIKTEMGFKLEGTHNHGIKVLRNKKIVWSRMDELKVGDRPLIDRSERWHNGKFQATIDESYSLGQMIGDGCWTKDFLRYASNDKFLVDMLEKSFKHKWKNVSDKHHYNLTPNGPEHREDWLKKWSLPYSYKDGKVLPNTILSANKELMSACLSGLFDTDGTLQVSTAKGGVGISVSFTNTSETLVDQMQYILLHYGILAQKNSRKRTTDKRETSNVNNWKMVHELLITGKDVKKFAKEINFWLPRKRNKLNSAIAAQQRNRASNDEIPGIKDDVLYLIEKYRKNIGYNSKFTAGLIKQRKTITHDFICRFFEYMKDINDPILENLKEISSKDIYYDRIVEITDGECVTYDMHVPDGNEYCVNGFFSHNSKIRGQRANYLIADEFNSISTEIFEVVVSGFASVSANPIEKIKASSRIKAMRRIGMDEAADEEEAFQNKLSNQTILSGTCGWGFEPFARYWQNYCNIINSRGQKDKLEEIFNGEIPPKFNWKDYSVIRIPVDMLPDGFMDEKHISKAKATYHSAIYNKEYGALFPTDSNGFFKRSLIESCVVGNNQRPISQVSCGLVDFGAALIGNPTRKYVMGIDPAAQQDNLAIVILECWPDHRRIVYCWTTNLKRFKDKVKKGLTKEQDYYRYAAKKIRDLCRFFNCERIAIDSQGGAISIMEALQDTTWLVEGEKRMLPIIEEGKDKPTDNMAGLHIIEPINFALQTWVAEANHGMRKDFEDKALLFPRFDSVALGLAVEEDEIKGRKIGEEEGIYDTLENCVDDIEELKDELSTIVHTQTLNSGRDHWSTPEIKTNGKKGRLRKDRYSALLMANMIGRQLQNIPTKVEFGILGGFVHELVKEAGSGKRKKSTHQNPAWYDEQTGGRYSFGQMVNRENKQSQMHNYDG